jgi:hypothetical protein
MNLHFQPILEEVNKTEVYLQELELVILNCMGSQKFKWNDFKDIKRKSSISDSAQRVRDLIENSQEVRESIRQLNREYLRLQLAIKNLGEFTQEIEAKAQEIESKLIEESFIKSPVKESFLSKANIGEIAQLKAFKAEETKSETVSVEPQKQEADNDNVLNMFETKDEITTIKASPMSPLMTDKRSHQFEYRVV